MNSTESIAPPLLDVLRLGRARYQPVWEMQRRIQQQRIASLADGREQTPDRLILVEHEPVYTWGKRARPANLGAGAEALQRLGADVFEVERGGDVTFHGPGQLVAYPICHLGGLSCGRDLHKYMRGLEQVVIGVLADYGLAGERIAGLTGVWVAPEGTDPAAKIAAIGTRVSKWVSLHGLALNVSDEPLRWFSHITPCGITDRAVTSLQSLLGCAPPMNQVEDRLICRFSQVFGLPM